MKVFASSESRRRALLLVVGVAVALVAGTLLLRTYAPFVFDEEQLRAWIEGFGPLAPLVFVLVQAVQVVVAPVPGQVTALVGGYVFGATWGTVYSIAGVMLGSAVAFLIAQTWGRPVVESLLHDEVVERFDGFVRGLGVPGLFLFVVVPGLPDDAICLFAGLAHFQLVTFLLVMLIGRSPAYIATNYAGQGLANGSNVEAVLVLVGLVAVSVVALRNRDRIRAFARR